MRRRSRVRRLGTLILPAILALNAPAAAASALHWAPPAGRLHGGALAARDLGGGRAPAVVLLHGLTGSNRYWSATFDQLARQGRLIVPDLLGFGRSPRPATGYTADAHADAVAACLREHRVEAPVLVVGHSFGALIALRLASRHPALVGGLVALAPPLYPDAATARRRLARGGPLHGLLAFDAPWSRATCEWAHTHPVLTTRLFRAAAPMMPAPLVADSLAHSAASYFESMERVLLAAEGDRWLAAAAVPVRMVAGDEDHMVDRPHLARLARRHAGATLASWPGAGHHLPLERPEACLAEVRRARLGLARRGFGEDLSP